MDYGLNKLSDTNRSNNTESISKLTSNVEKSDQIKKIDELKSTTVSSINSKSTNLENQKIILVGKASIYDEVAVFRETFIQMIKSKGTEFNELTQKDEETINKTVFIATSPSGEVVEMGPGEGREKFNPEKMKKLLDEGWGVKVHYLASDGTLHLIASSDDPEMRQLLANFLTMYVAYIQFQTLSKMQQKKDEKQLIEDARLMSHTHRSSLPFDQKTHPVKYVTPIDFSNQDAHWPSRVRLVEIRFILDILENQKKSDVENRQMRITICLFFKRRRKEQTTEKTKEEFNNTEIQRNVIQKQQVEKKTK